MLAPCFQPLGFLFCVDVQTRICGIAQSRSTAVNPHGDATDQITEADGQTAPEQRIAGVVVLDVEGRVAAHGADLGGEDDGHDDAVDGDDFAEDDGDEVLGADARGFDAAADNRGAGDEDAPVVRLLGFASFM